MSTLLTLFVFTLVIVIHEYGHFRAMRSAGVTVTEFSVGFGPPLYQRKMADGVLVSLRVIPLGGHVRAAANGSNSVGAQPYWTRQKIYFAGMFFNAATSFVALLIFFLLRPVPEAFPLVTLVPTVVRPFFAAFIGSFGLWLATPVLIVVMAVKMGMGFFAQTADPIGIVAIGTAMSAGSTFSDSVLGSVLFFAMLSTSIAGFNLLPIYYLDGGHAFLAFVERRMQGMPRWVETYKKVSLVFLLVLMAAIMFSDVFRLFR